jgi:hypothetical protein
MLPIDPIESSCSSLTARNRAAWQLGLGMCPRTPGSGRSHRLAIQEWTKPGDNAPGGRSCFALRRILTTREIADRSPRTHVLRIFAELLEAIGSIGARKDVHAAIAFVSLMTDENQPRLIEPRRHHRQCYSAGPRAGRPCTPGPSQASVGHRGEGCAMSGDYEVHIARQQSGPRLA